MMSLLKFTAPTIRMRLFVVFAFLICAFSNAQADTVDVYRVSFRGKVIKEFTEGQMINIVMRTDSVASTDTLKISVYRDAPCSQCTDYNLMVFGNKGPMLVDSSQNTASFYIPLKPLVEYRRKENSKSFHGYYTEYLIPSGARVVSFKITIE